MQIRLLELFGGIGACSAALKRLGVDYDIVDYVEIDKFAVKSYNAINGTDFEPQDITEWDKDIECDLIMHGSPCQDFSVAGKGAGGDKDSGTRSSLMYETIRIVEKLRPKYVIWENVKGVLSKRHKHNFDAYQNKMAELGYTNYYQVLNAKDYGVPQNRERVFTVSILGGGDFKFPEPMPLDKKLKDILEDNVDEKYYLSDKAVSGYLASNTKHEERGNGFKFEPTDGTVVGHSVTTKAGQRATDNYIVASRGRNPDNPSCRDAGIKLEQRLEARKDGLTNTITSVQKDNYVALPGAYGREFGSKGKIENRSDCISTLQAAMGCGGGNVPLVDENIRIRKLTPKECWRLMGFDDTDFEKAEKVNSNSQLYKQAGNSIVVNVLEAIFSSLIKNDT